MSTEISQPTASPSTPKTKNESGREPASHVLRNLSGIGIEAIDSLLWRLRTRHGTESSLVVGVTGCGQHAGASTIAHALAARAGQESETRVLLINASGHDHSNRGGQPVTGLHEILAGDVAPLECQMASPYENVDMIGMPADCNRAFRIEDRFVSEMLHEFASHYDAIVVDLPAAKEMKKSLALAKHLDGVVLVVRSEKTRQAEISRVVERLAQDGVRVLGTVLNGYRCYVPRWLKRWF